jgi:hypothetical protein
LEYVHGIKIVEGKGERGEEKNEKENKTKIKVREKERHPFLAAVMLAKVAVARAKKDRQHERPAEQ